MQAFELEHLLGTQAESKEDYLEFLRSDALSVGIYKLEAGAKDPQEPHNEDEVYYILSGRGMIQVGEEDQPVQTGSIVYVEKHVPHKFHSILEDLSILVFFAPAES